MAPHTITHCINDDTSFYFLRKSRHSPLTRVTLNIEY